MRRQVEGVKEKNLYRMLALKSEVKSPLGKPRGKWGDFR
jgi:hypothetical protein